MDFFRIERQETKNGTQLVPNWIVDSSFTDLMVRGKSFYAIWDEKRGLWSTKDLDVARLVDAELYAEAKKFEEKGQIVYTKVLRNFDSGSWESFRRYCQSLPDTYVPLDSKLIFANDEVKKSDYASHKLPYALEPGSTDAWDELLDVLYSEKERTKIEWAIGSVVSGDSRWIQKFLVFYGPAGTGKSTVLNVVEKLFKGYTTVFDAKALGSNNGAFAMEAFKHNPLVAIQHDGDLSQIVDNTKLNSIIAHEDMVVNEKYKATYRSQSNAFLFMGTNQPVKITDAKSGIIRRLLDVSPSGKKLPAERYKKLMNQLDFELGAIAHKCLDIYKQMGPHYYDAYRPEVMMLHTDVFYNFIEANFDIFKAQDGCSLKQAYQLYKTFCDDTGIDRRLPQYKFREELRNYFREFHDQKVIDGERVRSYYEGFKHLRITEEIMSKDEGIVLHKLDTLYDKSVFDQLYADQPAQYAKQSGFPGRRWENVDTVLSGIDPGQLHFVKVPENHIVIDFDLVNEDGEKDLTLNLEAASNWPLTYAEVSKSGQGLHLHYIYTGDVHELASVYDVGIEVKTLLGDSSLRRQLTLCNNHEIVPISSGLPLKEKPVIDNKTIRSEKGLRDLIVRNLRKEIHPGTKPSIDFIQKILKDAYDSGMSYDVSDMRGDILTFAAKSTNQSAMCIKLVQSMHFASDDNMPEVTDDSGPMVFYDVEVYPNLFVVCWKYENAPEISKMVNPTPAEIEEVLKLKLVGFNNRRYDNHILYARFLGYSLEDLYKLSQKIVEKNDRSAMFGEAYNLSYTDIYDFSSKKQGLKKFQIELGIHHMELDIPWDKPVPEELWPLVVEYCCNDVVSTEETFKYRIEDFRARQILASLSGLSVNHTTQNHTARIIFGKEKNPQKDFVYTDLSVDFPGYNFDGKESTYRGEVTGEGGYVYAEPGVYENVALLDVASMHPTSIEQLNLFGPYTKNFSALKEARLAIKHKDYETARGLLDGKLEEFLEGAENDPSSAEALSYALKIVINIVYGLTSARFDNPFRDIRNLDNIVAKRGALFMIDLKHEVQERGFTVAHIKTDSIKIPNATPEIIEFVFEFGKKYGYDFEHEATYKKFALVNEAVYIAKDDSWHAVGAQFQHPYVFKELFSREPIDFDDICEARSVVQGTMYLDMKGENNPEDLIHVGRTGLFVPVRDGGGRLWRIKDGKNYAVTGTKGYLWITADMAKQREEADSYELFADMDYFEELKKDAVKAIEQFGSFEDFVS